MTDSSLGDEAKKLLDELAKALPGLGSLDDGNGNLKYEHEQVEPFVEPLLEAVGLKNWKFTVWMWRTSFKWESLPAPVNIIPICNITESARSEPGGAFKYGVMRRIDGKVTVVPRLAAVFAVPPLSG